MIVCVCNGVSERDIHRAVAAGCQSLEALAAQTGCGTTCGCCRDTAREVLHEAVALERGFPLLQVA